METKPDIQIVDVSARDGLQNEPNAAVLSVEDKVGYIITLAKAGLKRIEAGSFVKPSAVPAMANSGDVAALLAAQIEKEGLGDVTFSYLVPNLKGLERAQSVNAKEVAIFLALSEKFSKANINQSVDQSFEDIRPVVESARAAGIRVRGYLSNTFGYDDLPFSPTEVALRSKQLLEMGCFEVSLGDTTGIGKPEQVEALIAELNAQGVPLAQIAMHFHDTFGAAIGNVDKAYALGIRIFDASTGGIGGCPYANSPKGNLSLQDLLQWCADRKIGTGATNSVLLNQASIFLRKKLGSGAVALKQTSA